jgi:hypothetical protein
MMIRDKNPDLKHLKAELTGGIWATFRKKTNGESVYSKIIRLWPFGGSAGRYSHEEIAFSNGWSWSSDEADDGTRFKQIDYSKGNWDKLFIPCTPEEERRVWEKCEKENGLKYDKRGIAFSFLPIPIGWQHPDRWFCSEACTAMLQLLGYMTGYSPASIAPSRAYKIMSAELASRVGNMGAIA